MSKYILLLIELLLITLVCISEISRVIEGKGLVGKLPGNPASCPEEPCGSDPQHVLYALKWTSLVFALVLILPLVMYWLSKLITKINSLCFPNSKDTTTNKTKNNNKGKKRRDPSTKHLERQARENIRDRLESSEGGGHLYNQQQLRHSHHYQHQYHQQQQQQQQQQHQQQPQQHQERGSRVSSHKSGDQSSCMTNEAEMEDPRTGVCSNGIGTSNVDTKTNHEHDMTKEIQSGNNEFANECLASGNRRKSYRASQQFELEEPSLADMAQASQSVQLLAAEANEAGSGLGRCPRRQVEHLRGSSSNLRSSSRTRLDHGGYISSSAHVCQYADEAITENANINKRNSCNVNDQTDGASPSDALTESTRDYLDCDTNQTNGSMNLYASNHEIHHQSLYNVQSNHHDKKGGSKDTGRASFAPLARKHHRVHPEHQRHQMVTSDTDSRQASPSAYQLLDLAQLNGPNDRENSDPTQMSPQWLPKSPAIPGNDPAEAAYKKRAARHRPSEQSGAPIYLVDGGRLDRGHKDSLVVPMDLSQHRHSIDGSVINNMAHRMRQGQDQVSYLEGAVIDELALRDLQQRNERRIRKGRTKTHQHQHQHQQQQQQQATEVSPYHHDASLELDVMDKPDPYKLNQLHETHQFQRHQHRRSHQGENLAPIVQRHQQPYLVLSGGSKLDYRRPSLNVSPSVSWSQHLK